MLLLKDTSTVFGFFSTKWNPSRGKKKIQEKWQYAMRAVCLLHANAFNELFRAIDDVDEVCCALWCAVLFSHHLIIIISSLRVLRGVCWSRIFLLENLPYDRFCTLLLSFWSTLHVYVFGFCNFFAFQRDLRISWRPLKTRSSNLQLWLWLMLCILVYPWRPWTIIKWPERSN